MLIFIVFLMVYQWTNISLLNWTPGVVSIVAIVIAFNSYVQSSVKSVNKQVVYSIAKRLISRLADKDDETFCLLSSLVALKQENYPVKLSTLYRIDKGIFEPKKLLEYFYLK